MKAALCVLLLAVALVAGEEKKTEKRGVLGLGYGLGHPAPVLGGYYGHGLGLYNHGIAAPSIYGHGLVGHGLVSHSLSAPIVGHGVYSSPLAYSPPLAYSQPLLGLGHGWH
ncbi:hypothetical protein evm_011563 [Chilo suppressalis]|nr:hypothetical protein evm_011563 [Chilo suppressalis]